MDCKECKQELSDSCIKRNNIVIDILLCENSNCKQFENEIYLLKNFQCQDCLDIIDDDNFMVTCNCCHPNTFKLCTSCHHDQHWNNVDSIIIKPTENTEQFIYWEL